METLQYEPERQALIRRSHERCLALGLGDSEHPDYGLLPRSELSEALERDRLLLQHARPVMQRLHGHVAETRGMVILADAQGLVMHTLGEGDFLERAQRIALSQGALWSESLKGTNAIGTAIVERRPTVVHANEHFVRAHHFITCAATPIQDSTGRLLGVLDVTGDQRGYREHTIALVRMSATTIENTLIGAGLREGISLRLHARPELIGTVAEGILAFDPCGKLVAANAAAREMLGGDARRMSTECVASLFGFGHAVLADRVREAEGRPLLLRLRDEAAVFAVGELREPVDAQATRVRTPGGVLTPETFGAFAQAVAARRAAEDAGMASPGPCPDAATAAPAPSVPCAPEEPRPAPREAPRGGALDALDTGDPRLAQLLAQLRRVIDRDIPILVLGETGTGKELLARAIHADSRRAAGPFVAVNCAAIPETLIESELFGYEEGAFTGARRKGATGRIQQAHRGTLFLDEIGDMPPSLQARLLRVLQERAVSPLGGTRSVPVDVAVVCATHRNVRELIDTGRFREDLYYRVNGLTVRLPPLRERQDLPRIVQRILDTELQGAGPGRVAPDAMMLLQRHRWPGNIRQLANVLRTACALAGDEPTITAVHLPEAFMDELQGASTHSVCMDDVAGAHGAGAMQATGRFAAPPGRAETPGALDLAGHELALIRQALAACGGNVSLAARQLGISRNTIYRKLRATGE